MFACSLFRVKILIIKPSSLGDVVQTLPVLRLLRRHWPQAHIAWCLAEGLIPLLENDPDVNEIIPFQRKGWSSLRGLAHWRKTIVHLRERKFDLVIDLQSLLRSGLVAWLARGTTTAGLDLRREGANLFYDLAVPRPTDRPHAVDWYLAVLRELGVPTGDWPELIPPRADIQKRLRRIRNGSDKPMIALIPGARWDNKRWPAAHFAALTKQLDPTGRRYDFAILGARNDSHLAAEITNQADRTLLDLTGQTSLKEMIEWLRLSSLVITNDTGPMHIASALGKPLVGLFGPTDHRQTGPWGAHAQSLRIDLPCAPCMKSRCRWKSEMQCLHELSPAMVALSAQSMLQSE